MFKAKLYIEESTKESIRTEGSAFIGPQCSLRVDIPFNGSSRLYCADDLIKFTGKEKTLASISFQ